MSNINAPLAQGEISAPTIELIHRHRSIRRYKSDPVSSELVETIVAAAQRSSTSSNLQTYSVVAVTDPTKRHRLAELCGNQRHIREAPVFLAWCADWHRLARACEIQGYRPVTNYVESFLIAAVDAAIAMQTAALAAESLGLGMCFIGGIRNDPAAVAELLQLPQLVFPISGMTLGWPAEEPIFKPRLPLKAVLHWEHYDTSREDEALREYDRIMQETGIYKGRQVTVKEGEPEHETYGWLEHSARRASQPARTHLRRVLQEMGFDLE
ncbi:MAG: NADPH-dependent oxidoreductase [Chloroflexi bacterium]|nr:NADPH-dependent oxidoreductase [Chloroflexota bacterium]